MTIGNYKQLVKALIESEKQVNRILYTGVPIGGLLSRLFFNISKNDHRLQISKRLDIVPRMFVRATKNFYLNKRSRFDKKIVATKIADRASNRRLIDPLVERYQGDLILVSSKVNPISKNNILFREMEALPPWTFLKILAFSMGSFFKIRKILANNDVPCSDRVLFNTILVQLVRLETALGMLNNSPVELVIADFDRNAYVSPLVLAAKRHKISTVTLVHGAIYPPYGYNPLNADEIWCWSSLQRTLLHQMGIALSQIKVMGNPIAEEASIPTDEQLRLKRHLGVEPTCFVVGLALNPIGSSNNASIIKLVENAVKAFTSHKMVVLIKKHPFMSENDINLNETDNNIVKIFDHVKYSNEQFFGICDLMLSRGSSIGYEAILNNVLAGVVAVDAAETNRGNLDIMVDLCHCPSFGAPEELTQFLIKVASDGSFKQTLLEKQKKFVITEYYAAIGKEALMNFSKRIDSVAFNFEKSSDFEIAVTEKP